ncbi:MAG: GNAT family N-acetyltransferase [Bryobacteraceae bacterium]
MNVRLRLESASDELFVRRLIVETIAHELGAAAWPEPMRSHLLGIQYNGRRQSNCSKFPESASYIVEADAEDSGWLVTTTLPDEIRLVEIMVLTVLRGNGIGTSVIRGILADAAQKQIPVRLNVNKTNRAAIRLYERLGFRAIDSNEVQQVMECPPHPEHAGSNSAISTTVNR